MKAFLTITLLSVVVFQAHAIDGVDFKVLSKECDGLQLSVDAREKFRFVDSSMTAVYGPGAVKENQSCTKVDVASRYISERFIVNDQYHERSQLTFSDKREVCRNSVTNAVLTDVTTKEELSVVFLTADIDAKSRVGTIKLTGAPSCKNGELLIKVAGKEE